MTTTPQIKSIIKGFQQNEITEHVIYLNLAKTQKNMQNRETLETIAAEEKAHYDFWKQFTEEEIAPDKWKVFKFTLIAKTLGITFAIKLMEKGEAKTQMAYASVLLQVPNAQNIIDDEDKHEEKLINMLKEEKLDYVGSIVLGLNDALVELTGALAGLSFGFQNTKIIAFAGLITGIAASFSMAAAEYLSQTHEGSEHPMKSAVYTGIAYLITVGLLISPYLIFTNYLVCLFVTLSMAVLIILFFNYYVAIAKDLPFKRRFFEMAFISIGVSAITFGISVLIKNYFGIEV